jgi:hypothetical protein
LTYAILGVNQILNFHQTNSLNLGLVDSIKFDVLGSN